jgi:hypothetical protein
VPVRLEVIEPDERRDLARDAWPARVPKKPARAYLDADP